MTTVDSQTIVDTITVSPSPYTSCGSSDVTEFISGAPKNNDAAQVVVLNVISEEVDPLEELDLTFWNKGRGKTPSAGGPAPGQISRSSKSSSSSSSKNDPSAKYSTQSKTSSSSKDSDRTKKAK